MRHQSELTTEVRLPELSDAQDMLRHFLDRKHDSAPDYPEHTSRRIEDFEAFGLNYFGKRIKNVRNDPAHYFSRVALTGMNFSGFASAEALPDSSFTWWRGLTIARQYDRQGIGSQLEESRQAWAIPLGRPVLAKIVSTNKPSMAFFQRHDFTQIGVQVPTPETPMEFNIMWLKRSAPIVRPGFQSL